MGDRYTARSASNKTDDWPFWFVSKDGNNVTPDIMRHAGFDPNGQVFLPREVAQAAAAYANKLM